MVLRCVVLASVLFLCACVRLSDTDPSSRVDAASARSDRAMDHMAASDVISLDASHVPSRDVVGADATDGATDDASEEPALEEAVSAAKSLANLRRANRETPGADVDGFSEWTPRQKYRLAVVRAALRRYVRAAVEESAITSRPGAIETRIDHDLTRIVQGLPGGMLPTYDETRVTLRDEVLVVVVDFAMGCGYHHDVFAFAREATRWRYFASTTDIELPSPQGGLDVGGIERLAPTGGEHRLLLRIYGTFCASQWHGHGILVLQGDGVSEGRVSFRDRIATCFGCGPQRTTDFGRTATGFWVELAVQWPSTGDDSPAPRACLQRIHYEVGNDVRRLTDPYAGRCSRRVF